MTFLLFKGCGVIGPKNPRKKCTLATWPRFWPNFFCRLIRVCWSRIWKNFSPEMKNKKVMNFWKFYLDGDFACKNFVLLQMSSKCSAEGGTYVFRQMWSKKSKNKILKNFENFSKILKIFQKFRKIKTKLVHLFERNLT